MSAKADLVYGGAAIGAAVHSVPTYFVGMVQPDNAASWWLGAALMFVSGLSLVQSAWSKLST